MTPPPCPITGEPAARLIQWVSADLLAALWRIEFGVDARPSFRGVTRFGLWESATGLVFFDPMLEGDPAFYAGFYRNAGMGRYLSGSDRGEFRLAAAYVRDGVRVLDVGCGRAAFRGAIPRARYTGLDPHLGGDGALDGVRSETLADHLARGEGMYDVVCAFQVLEHVATPLRLLREMARAARPGGTILVGVPHVASAPTRIPNWLTNAVPHHLTWWSEEALTEAAARSGLACAFVQRSPWSRNDVFVYWMSHYCPVRCTNRFYGHRWTWHGAALLGAALGYLASKVRAIPAAADEEGAALLLVAERPASGTAPRPPCSKDGEH